MKKIIDKIRFKIKAYFHDEFEVTVWFAKEVFYDANNEIKMCTRTDGRVFNFSKLSKITNTHIKGKDMNNKPLEIITNIPFDYQVKKLY